MKWYHHGALGLSLVVALLVATGADGQQRQPDISRLQIGLGRTGPLLPEGAKDKLNLTAEQKDKIAKLEKEFDDKSKESTDKLRESIQKAVQDKDISGLQGLRDLMEANQKLRTEYEGKVAALLTDEQKKKFEEATKDAPRRPGAGFQPQRQTDKGLQSPDVQQKLELTKEQKEKLADIQKEAEKKALEVLTQEQKKKYEELKKEQPRSPFGRRPGGN